MVIDTEMLKKVFWAASKYCEAVEVDGTQAAKTWRSFFALQEAISKAQDESRIDALVAGPMLNEQVAMMVMRWTPSVEHENGLPRPSWFKPLTTRDYLRFGDWTPSTSSQQAWEAIRTFPDHHTLVAEPCDEALTKYKVSFREEVTYGDTCALALCRAALKAASLRTK